ncbi:hypothetical protein [Lujinxingia litoralis]|uniref:hypothetical protein n=1 Tax=Lujinxingia litoralis TaxID=2211119 RepID=UPI001313FCBE|nr:hypothetical protein [Lujinxingia litoralis]
MARIQLLSGPAVQQSLHDEPGAQLFRYRLNTLTLGAALGLGLILLLVAALLFFGPGLGGFYTAGFIASMALGLTLCSVVSYWSNFARKHFVATTDHSLLVGRNDNAWRVDWSLVTRETLDFEGMTLSPTRARLDLRAGGQHIAIPIFTPFVYLGDLEALMLALLERLDIDPGALSEDSADDVLSSSDTPDDARSEISERAD